MNSRATIAAVTFLVMIAFATNSVLGRAALRSDEHELIDPATYTTVRVVAGALVLGLIQLLRRKSSTVVSGEPVLKRWLPAVMLTGYAVCFSYAYVRLDAATGTLILFAFVQLTMVLLGVSRGEKPRAIEVVGMLVAFGGLVYLLAPGVGSFSLFKESALMMLSGIAWGAYSFLGKGSDDPIARTATNFARSVPFVVIVSLVMLSMFQVTPRGVLLAVASGGITSGLGYVLWYLVLPHLKSTQAAVVQLSVPIIAAVGGVIFAGDSVQMRTVFAGLLILGGIALTIDFRRVDRT